jgi:TonB family protein
MKYLAIVLGLLCAVGAPISAFSATVGIAYDSVSKSQIGAVAPPAIPQSSFDDDFRIASQGGSPQSLSTGITQRIYLTPTEERTDFVNRQRATIVDCAAKTVTTLDLSAKTYTVRDFDQPYPIAPAATGTAALDFKDAKVTMAVASAVLGPKIIANTSTDAYTIETSIMMSLASGTAMFIKTNVTAYYADTRVPKLECPKGQALATGEGFSFGPMASFGSTIGNALQNASAIDQSVVRQGPQAPTDRLLVLETGTIQMLTRPMMSASVLIERGNVRAISNDDPVFSTPSDFKPVSSVSVSKPTAVSSASPGCATPHTDAALTNAVAPEYTASAREQGATGTVLVKVVLSPTGNVTQVGVYRSSGNDALDNAALQAALAGSYSPETNDCKPVGGSYIFHANFDKQ